ncbi:MULTISPECIES: hypothetical protein [unclassified Rathayibacter]|uniref:hypothetical protein n=1 Tax=unclassified Rathayibacter TaxID=2609250 RepID=UPI00104CFD48|nr:MULTISPECIES: hypothetical protein [unclassified Rathayibacter]TCL84811.1 hypothetical protein EDF49_102484 [Rathayibacter sp. PhB192]TCM30529.1 hypothetical protein EDF43_102484 [Rathayibacter sp. PhB179]
MINEPAHDTVFYDSGDGRMAMFSGAQYERDLAELWHLVSAAPHLHDALIEEEVERIFAKSGGDYLNALGERLSSLFAFYCLREVSDFNVQIVAIPNWRAFVTAFRQRVTPMKRQQPDA